MKFNEELMFSPFSVLSEADEDTSGSDSDSEQSSSTQQSTETSTEDQSEDTTNSDNDTGDNSEEEAETPDEEPTEDSESNEDNSSKDDSDNESEEDKGEEDPEVLDAYLRLRHFKNLTELSNRTTKLILSIKQLQNKKGIESNNITTVVDDLSRMQDSIDVILSGRINTISGKRLGEVYTILAKKLKNNATIFSKEIRSLESDKKK